MQTMFNLIRKHCLLQKNFTTQMPKYNVLKNCQPDFYNEKPAVYGSQVEPLVIIFYEDKRNIYCVPEKRLQGDI